jgi:hypothetical protein
VWTSNETTSLFTDSAGGRDKGFGIYFQGKWARGCWPKEWADNGRCVPLFLKRLISLALIFLCFMTYPPTPKTIFLTARFTRFRAFHCFILTWYYIVRTVKQDLTRVITLLDFEDFLLIIATTAWLSTLKIICLFFKCIPQMCTEMTTGNNSKT